MRRSLLLALALLLPAPAEALVVVSNDGLGNSSAPPDDPGWDHVGRVGAYNGTYLGNGWVVTANHVTLANAIFQGVTYPAVPGSEVQLVNPDQSLADLKVFRINPSPNLPLLRIRPTTPPKPPSPSTPDVTMIGVGRVRGAATTWAGYDGFFWNANPGDMHWGTNRVYNTGFAGGSWTISTDFTKASAGGTNDEAQAADGDSGGALFIKRNGTWELAGVLFAISPFANQPDSTALFGKPSQPVGNTTYAIDLAVYRQQLIDLTRPQCSNEKDDDGDGLIDWPADPGCTSELDTTEQPDQDLDGVGDPEDNCLTVPNPDQRDSNLDGFGNLCDGDFDGDGAVTSVDLMLFKQTYLKGVGDPGYDADMDLDGDGAVTSLDFTLFRPMYLGQPGPSGLSCAGVPPCP